MAFASFLSRGAAVLSMCVFAEAISCPNRHYCDTKEVKYRAFSALNDAYLHSTGHVIRNLPIKNRLDCKRECVRTSGCQSSNYFQKINSNVMMCEIMAGNRWSNASRLIRKMNSTHFFIQVSEAIKLLIVPNVSLHCITFCTIECSKKGLEIDFA